MGRSWRQSGRFVGLVTLAAAACLAAFAVGYQVGHVQGWNDLLRVMRSDPQWDAVPPRGWLDLRRAFPDDDPRMK
jgi:hypothetical protein